VAPLFDIGLGMDVESTGYENIILRGLYLSGFTI
jgi:ABC-2 type transport system ATP-binding protein/lipopolysaccharide transport system ATP-binding protein